MDNINLLYSNRYIQNNNQPFFNSNNDSSSSSSDEEDDDTKQTPPKLIIQNRYLIISSLNRNWYDLTPNTFQYNVKVSPIGDSQEQYVKNGIEITNKYIVMHDTTIDEIYGETVRLSNILGWDANKQSQETGIPVEEINCGLWRAIEEFLDKNDNWILKKRYMNCYGLTILERIRD